MKRIAYYIKIWIRLIKLSLKRARLYKTEIISRLIRGAMLFGLQALIVESLFIRTDLVAGVSRPEYYLIVGSYNIINYLGWAIFNVNIRRLQEKIIKGELDYPLTKPTGSLFEIVFGEFFIDDMLPIISGFIFVGFYIAQASNINLMSVLLYVVALGLGFLIWLSLHLLIGALGFIFIGNAFLDVLTGLAKTASAPSSIWNRYEILLYVILPTGLVSTFPAAVLNGTDKVVSWPIAVVVTVMGLAIAIAFWNFSLKRYESGN
jgi:ABC-type uncharacterized transport system permease subunit